MRRDHGDAEVEEAVAEADRTFQPIQGLRADGVRFLGRALPGRRRAALLGLLGGGGPRRGQLPRRPFPAALLEVGDVAVTLVVHLPGFAEGPASFDVSCEEIGGGFHQYHFFSNSGVRVVCISLLTNTRVH